MKHKIAAVLLAGAFFVGTYGSSAFAQSSSTNEATKPDREQASKSGTADTTTPAPVDPSKSDKPGEATAPKASTGTDNPKTGVQPTKPGAADQTQAPK